MILGSSRRNNLVMKPKEVVISAMKQPQKRTEFFLAVSESSPEFVIVVW